MSGTSGVPLPGEEAAVRELGAFGARLRVEDVPDEVRRAASGVLLDLIGVTLAGSEAAPVAALAGRIALASGTVTLPGRRERSTALWAAVYDGMAGTWLDFDPAHRHPPGEPLIAAGHPPVHAFAAALPVAEATGASGAGLLAALIAGIEVAARVGVSCRLRPEVHPHGTHPNVGAAVAAARLLGAGDEGVADAIRLAAGMSLMPSFESAYQGALVRNAFAGLGGMLGALAPRLLGRGFTAQRAPLGGVFGAIASDWIDPGLLTAGLGRTFELGLGYHKPFPCCRYLHPAIEAAEALVPERSLDPADVESVDVATYALAARLDERAPRTELAAKFSIPYGVATMLVRGSARREDFGDAAVGDPAVRAVAARTAVREEPAFTAVTPGRRPARVTVRLRDGRVLRSEVERSSGGPDAPWTRERVREKFHLLAAPVIGDGASRAAAGLVDSITEVARVSELTALLRPA